MYKACREDYLCDLFIEGAAWSALPSPLAAVTATPYSIFSHAGS